jgi:hypothetical protein
MSIHFQIRTHKKALLQASKSLNVAMTVDVNNQNQVIDAANIAGSVKCIYSLYDPKLLQRSKRIWKNLWLIQQKGVAAYEQFNTAVSGSSFVLPQGNGCEN